MAFTERLALLISADVDGAVRGLQKVGEHAERDLGKAESKMDKVGSTFSKVGAGMVGAGVLAAAGLVKAAQASSDLNEAVNVTGLIFRDARGEIDRFSQEAARNVGLSERAAREATANFGGLLQNLGFAQDETVKWSKNLTTLGADMASAFNTDISDAITAIGAGLRGESEPLKRYNVFLDDTTVKTKAVEMGLAASTATVDRHAKAQAALALIMQQTSAVQGDFKNTSDGLANSQRIFAAELENAKAALGEAMLPVMQKVVGATGGLLEGFNNLAPSTKSLVSEIGAVGAGGLVAAGGLSMVVGQVIKARENFSAAIDAVKSFGAAMKGNLTMTGAVTVGLAAGALVLADWAAQKEAARRRTEEFIATLSDETGALTANTRNLIINTLEHRNQTDDLRRAGISYKEWTDAVQSSGDKLMDLNEIEALQYTNKGRLIARLRDEGGARNELVAKLVEEDEANRGVLRSLKEQSSAYDEGQQKLKDRKAIGAEVKTTNDAIAASADSAAGGESQFNSALGDTEDTAKKAKQALDDFLDSIGNTLDRTFSMDEATDRWKQSINGLADSVLSSGRDLDGFSEAALKNRNAMRDLVRAGGDVIKTMVEQGRPTDEITTRQFLMRKELENVGKTLGLNKDEIRKYTDALGSIQTDVRTSIYMDGLTPILDGLGTLGGYLAMLDGKSYSVGQIFGDVPGGPGVTGSGVDVKEVQRTLANEGFLPPNGVDGIWGPKTQKAWEEYLFTHGGVPGRATGGPVSAGEMYWVGERGPELFVPASAGHVVPNGQASRVTGGVTVNQHFYGRTDAEEAGKTAGREMRRQNFLLAGV